MGQEALKAFRDRFNIPISDDEIAETPFYRPDEDSPEMRYMREKRQALGGYLPARRNEAEPLAIPDCDLFGSLLAGTDGREMSTTMATVRLLSTLARDKGIGKNVVPIVPDEARTFGMEGMFRQLGIYSSVGQLYEPVDIDQLMYYREDIKGQILNEGINEAGAVASWLAAGTAYSNHGVNMIPFFISYSMFGFQRIGDLLWLAGDIQARGFLLGGTAGRTTLAGEGLQHQDGHSHLAASTIPNCISYDPTYGYELAVIIHDGLRRMYQHQENIFYYITVMNENYEHPVLPDDVEEGILKGMYLLQDAGKSKKPRVQLFGSGTILREAIAAADLLHDDFGVVSDIWSITSFNLLRRDGLSTERWNLLHPEKKPRSSYLEQSLKGHKGPVVAATDYMKIYADQVRKFVPRNYSVLGTDGFGRSDTREQLRRFFEVDRYYITVAALSSLAEEGEIEQSTVSTAISKYGIDPEKPEPTTV